MAVVGGECGSFAARRPPVQAAEITTRRLAAQYQLSRILANCSTLEAAAGRVLEVVSTSLDCVLSELWVLDRAARALRCAAWWAAPGTEISSFTMAATGRLFQSGEGLPGRVLAMGTPQWIRDVRTESGFRRSDEANRLGLRTAIAFPIQFAGETTGVIEFFDRKEREPDGPLLGVFADVGSQLGLFLERVVMSELVRQQSRELIELSTPVLRIWDRVLLAPMIGTLDSARATHAMDRIVETVVATGARVVLVDMTGVPHLDTAITQFVLDTIRATRLVGAKVILTGVRAPLAKTLVRLGVQLDDVLSTNTLADGLRMALAMSPHSGT